MTDEKQEHYIKVAEGFGLSHKEPEVTRRGFLRGLIATGALVAMPPTGLFMPPEPKIHQVSAGLVPTTGLIPIKGQPGLFMDAATGQRINIRDFREGDKYDTIVIDEQREPGVTYDHVKPLVSYHALPLKGPSMARASLMYGMQIALAGKGE